MKKMIIISLLVFAFFSMNFVTSNKSYTHLTDANKISYKQTKTFLANFAEDALIDNSIDAINSPLGMFMVLSMMSETIDTKYQKLILNYLGIDTIGGLREVCTNIMKTYEKDSLAEKFAFVNLSYRNQTYETQYGYNNNIVNILKQNYLVKDNYITDRTSNEIVNEIYNITDGFIKTLPSSFNSYLNNPLIVQLFINVLYFKDEWATKFTSKQIQDVDFTTKNNVTNKVKMLADTRSGDYFENEMFQYGNISFKNGCKMNFILPNETSSIEECLNNNIISKIINSEFETQYANINYLIPKFDKSFTIDFTNLLKNSDLNDIYEEAIGYNYLNTEWNYELTIQTSRIKLDEDGVRAATATMSCGAGKDSYMMEPAILHLTRPFIYYISTCDGYLLFSGTISNL